MIALAVLAVNSPPRTSKWVAYYFDPVLKTYVEHMAFRLFPGGWIPIQNSLLFRVNEGTGYVTAFFLAEDNSVSRQYFSPNFTPTNPPAGELASDYPYGWDITLNRIVKLNQVEKQNLTSWLIGAAIIGGALLLKRR